MEFRTGSTNGSINWLNNQTFTPQPLFGRSDGSGTYIGPTEHPSFGSISSPLSKEIPWWPNAGSSWATGSTVDNEAAEQLHRMNLGL